MYNCIRDKSSYSISQVGMLKSGKQIVTNRTPITYAKSLQDYPEYSMEANKPVDRKWIKRLLISTVLLRTPIRILRFFFNHLI